ncbi:pseudouridylate synthase-like protein 3 [Clohesyomyces aquaticus]|uniref:Pseudouridylate synthase-like protein 3 n=1 Tax=Clohesyomyces aquaticus TaxID=1231657 RepID=A0A1Y1ZEU3_9PLEO|nr:pseudouridylate synthase-like protein 3 [Clohesyomyces aquaticus]
MSSAKGYEAWNQKQLIARIKELEEKLQQQPCAQKELRTGPPAPNPATCVEYPIATKTGEQKPVPYRKPPRHQPKDFDASKYSTRLIALKFAYLGQKYNGFEHHKNNTTPLPTIEEELWKALMKTRLINPTPESGEKNGDYGRLDQKKISIWDRQGAEVNWDGCEYSKCGRTDRGVSAFGQVIGVRIRSNRPLPKPERPEEAPSEKVEEAASHQDTEFNLSGFESEPETPETEPFDDASDELPYIQLLNRVLPPDIRIYAWCPNPPADFSARFSCKERRYKYFFTNPCFSPNPGSSGLYAPTGQDPTDASSTLMREGWLDIAAMRTACDSLIGLHDFRNFCKIDASKQITNFQRRIFHASIEEISPLSLPAYLSHSSLQSSHSTSFSSASDSVPGSEGPKMYAFVLHGSAFLWHQVRSIIAILFLIGQGLEPASLIPSLLDISQNPTRPKYEMASDAPLVLWDCVFPAAEDIESSEVREHGYEDSLAWIFVGDPGGMEPKGRSGGGGIGRGKWGRGGVMDDLWEVWRGRKMEETLGALLMDTVARQGKYGVGDGTDEVEGPANKSSKTRPRVFDGDDVPKAKGNYIPVLKRERQEPVEVVNEKYARRKGLDVSRVAAKEEDADE